LDWRKGFAVQGFALIIIAIGFMCFDNSRLDIFGDRIADVPMNIEIKSVHSRFSQKTRRDVAVEKFGTSLPIDEFMSLLKNRVYFYTMWSLCAIYFSSSALQFWCTNYLITVMKMQASTAHILFGCSAITAPLLGAAVGGYITDAFVSLLLFLTNNFRAVIKGGFSSSH
jgi:sugar phosphate permease